MATNIDRNFELLNYTIVTGQSKLLNKYQELNETRIENISDVENIMKWFYMASKFIKREQRLIRLRIKELNRENSDEDSVNRWNDICIRLEANKLMFDKALDFYSQRVELLKYEPEKLLDPKVQEEFNDEFRKIEEQWVELIINNK